MARTGKSKKRNKARVRKRPSAFLGTVSSGSGAYPQRGTVVHEEREAWYSSEWQGSRAGSRASRGFHFQDVVGAWFASRLASGELAVDCIVPEGFDDLQIDADGPVQVEVKSRQGRLGSFPVRVAARHIVDAWLRHVGRFGTDRRLIVVLERGIEGWENDSDRPVAEIPLSRLIEGVGGLQASLTAEVASRGRSPTVAKDMQLGTALLICSWDGLIADIERHLGSVVNLPTAALGVVARALQVMVANAVDANAEAKFEDRSILDRTSVVENINRIAEFINVESMEHALTLGICSPIDKVPLEIGDHYYEGVSTQPGHVGAGLVVPRTDLVSQTIASLDMSQAVLLVGPSGVGKSAVLWALPFALPGVLWFRVNRMSDDDVPHVVRLLRAYRVSPEGPVGLLVDAVGNTDLAGWSRLRKAVASIPGALLVGTARSEDLPILGNLTDCRTVGVSLNEEAAAAIHAGLTRRGATIVPHWREAFEQSRGLTLEFTHLLTQGTRLDDVIADQVAKRVIEGRALELQVLAIVTAADRWSVSIPVEALIAALNAGPTELRAALARLVEEHLLVERNGLIAGIHQIRSRIIVDVIHRVPPPTLEATVVSVLTMLHGPALSRFLYEVLREVPNLEKPVLEALRGLVRDDVERLLACLRGLELLDFYRQAAAWAQIAERHGVPLAHRPVVLQFAITGIEVADFFAAQIRSAIAEMASLPEQSTTRNVLLWTVGPERIASELAEATGADACLRLLGPFGRTSIDWRPILAALKPGSPFGDFLRSCSLSAFGDCVSSARGVSVDLARAFVDAVGGSEVLLERFRNSDPWLQELKTVSEYGELIGVARFLYVSEPDQGDAREYAVEIGRQLLRTLPDIDRVDVKAVLCGGRTLEVDGFEYGSSRLLRQYDHHPATVGWNQVRIRLAQTLFGASETERLTESAGLLAEAAELVRESGNAFVQSRGRPAEDLDRRRIALTARGQSLPPQLGMSPLSEEGGPELSDPLSGVITNICGNMLPRLTNLDGYAALSAFVNQTVLGKNIPAVKEQPWRLIGFESAPPVLDELSIGLSDIAAVLTELRADASSASKIVSAGRRGTLRGALGRAAKLSRQLTHRRIQKQRAGVRTALQTIGWTVDVFWCDGDPAKGEFSKFAVTVTLDSLVDWPAACEAFIPKVQELSVLGQQPLLVPVVNDRSVLRLTVRVGSRVWAGGDFGEFEHLLPEQLDQRLTSPFIAARSALEVYSALSVLRRNGGLHYKVRQLLERTLLDYDQATTAIQDVGEDIVVAALTEWLRESHGQVEKEWNDESAPGTFAESVVEGVLQPESPEAQRQVSALLLSLQWDSNPARAIAWLESLEE